MNRLLMVAVSLGLCACANLEQTTVFYTPSSSDYYPPWPKKTQIPLLGEPPPWSNRVIGKFDMETDRGPKFARAALLFNARRQGADAIVMRYLNYDVRRNYNYIPPSWENIPITNYYNQWVQNNKGKWVNVVQPYTTFMPIFRPGRTVVDDVMWTHVRADMVVRRGKNRSPSRWPNKSNCRREVEG